MRINVVMTKVFQAVAVRYLGRSLEVNIDRVPYTDDEIDVPILEGVTVGKVIGSGMVAVVFEGMSEVGPVVLKVKRRNIERRIEEGLRDAERILTFIRFCPGTGVLGLDTVHDEVKELLLGQLDFMQEAANQIDYKEMLEGNETIVIPTVYEDWCTEDMIVMEKLSGTRHPTHRKESANAIASAIGASVVEGLLHADLHVGNVIFMGEKVGIIDFGLMLRLSPEELEAYTGIFSSSILKNYNKAAELAMVNYMQPSDVLTNLPEDTRLKLVTDMSNLFERAQLVNKSFGVTEVLSLASLVRPHGLTISPIFYKTMMSMAAGDMLMKDLTPNPLDFIMAHVAMKLMMPTE
jgi:ubiquinone biosynthesis protein